MLKSTRLLMVLFALPLLSSCTSAFKKQCKETNWFQHGHDIAMSGKRLNSDSFPQRCEEEGVPVSFSEMDLGFKAGMSKYCQPDVALQTGKNGDPLNLEMCASSDHSLLRSKHHSGVLIFCESSNGFPFGSSGKAYAGVCPKNLELAFLKEFRRGRKVFLTEQIAGKEAEVQELDGEIADLRNKQSEIKNEIAELSSSKLVFALGGTSEEREASERRKAEEASRAKDSKEWERSRLEREIEQKRMLQKNLRSDVIKLRTEAAGL